MNLRANFSEHLDGLSDLTKVSMMNPKVEGEFG